MAPSEEIIDFDTDSYDFARCVRTIFRTDDLASIHTMYKNDARIIDGKITFKKENVSRFHGMFYDKLNSGWPELTCMYRKFIKDIIYPRHKSKNGRLIYQKYPTVRFHLPGNKAVGTVHHDGDELHGHPPGELNYWMPLTDIEDETSTIWRESEPGKGDYRPAVIKYGQMLSFDGNRCNHFNKFNQVA